MPKNKPFKYEVTEIGEKTWLVNEFLSTMFILEGDEKSLVIDCGTGVGDFKSVIESVTKKPYIIAQTHTHVDHVGGRGQFNELHVGKPDIPFIKGVNLFQRRGYILINRFGGNSFSGLNVKPVKNEPKIIPVDEGTEFRLGNRTIKAFMTPGHTVGSVSYLDEKNRTVFIGDVANEFLLMYLPHATTIDTMIDTMEKLIGRTDYDTIWSSHHTSPQTRDDINIYLENARMIAENKNTLLPIIKHKVYKDTHLMYRSSNIH